MDIRPISGTHNRLKNIEIFASLHRDNKPVFSSVIIVTDRKVLDSQLQATIDGFDHTMGSVVCIDDKKRSKDLLAAIEDRLNFL